VTGSWEYLAEDSYDKVVSWYEKEMDGRGGMIGSSVADDVATWNYEPAHYDQGIIITVTRNGNTASVVNMTYQR
jgi:hypothetical protein